MRVAQRRGLRRRSRADRRRARDGDQDGRNRRHKESPSRLTYYVEWNASRSSRCVPEGGEREPAMTRHSERLHELAAALARAQGQIDPVVADAVGYVGPGGDGRSYRYATLTSVWEAIRPMVVQNGLAVVQTCKPGNAGELRLTTTLLHKSGQWVSGTMVIPLLTPTPQGYGSALTYARRYGLAAMVGLCVDTDDDGAACSQLTSASKAGRPAANHRSM
ncbi:MAG: hypothetical protein GEU73_03520 [Chloroflexi bacterium]|nr:hypothetical protein [Chloroflexota bacterium]